MIADFLDNYRPGGPFVLTSIVPDGKTETRTFTDSKEAEAWAIRQNETKNIYFHVNRTRGPLTAKAKKEDIAAVEYLHVDIDPRTGEDFEQERARILRLLTAELPKGVPAPSLVIDSGGGFQAFWRLAEPLNIDGDTDKAHEAERYNRALELAFGADSCHDVSRIMRTPGTMNWPNKKKRDKGREPREAEVYSRSEAVYPLTAFKAAPPITGGTPTASRKASPRCSVGDGTAAPSDWVPGHVSPFGTEELAAWATANGKAITDHTLALIASPHDPAQYKSRSEAQFRVSCDLVRADVPDEIHFRILTDPSNAVSASVRDKPNWPKYARDQIQSAREKVSEEPPVLHPKTPMKSAREFVARERSDLLHYNGDWLAYEAAAYAELEDATVRRDLYHFLEQAKMPPTEKQKEAGLRVGDDFRPDTTSVNHVLDALRAVAHRPRDSFKPPCWLEGDGPPARELVACRNGLLHLPTGDLLDHTPRFFTRNALTFDYDASAPAPSGWLAFLETLWPDEPEAVTLLQEIFGYLLIPDTSQQKIFLMVGPTRSGKGTIARVLTELVGPPNICAPSLADFGETFGLEPLLGKQLAILSDVRLDGKANHAAIAESLLKISGEDTVTVKRKFKSAWDGRLGVRFMLLSNLMPRFSDASPALANRFVPLLMDQSFLGREDHDLLTKLLPELPGILNWAIDGWRRLRERGRFNLPQSSRDAIQQLIELAAPVATFMREECELDPEGEVAKAELFDRWKNWCDRNGTLPGALNSFSMQLYAATSARVRSKKSRKGDDRVMVFAGLRLKNKSPF